MHTDPDDKFNARRLHTVGEESSEMPHDRAEFLRRRRGSMLTRAIERNRPAAIAASVLATVLVAAVPFVRSSHQRTPALVSADRELARLTLDVLRLHHRISVVTILPAEPPGARMGIAIQKPVPPAPAVGVAVRGNDRMP